MLMSELIKRKAKRKLSNIDFSKEGAHLALVSESQGGPANGADYALVMKSVNFSDEFIKKASQVTVTLEITDFLCRFFGMYGEDAEVLARALGLTTAMQDDEAEDAAEDAMESEPSTYKDYIQSKLEAFEVMKSLYEATSIPEVLSSLNEDEYLSMLKDQELIEKAFKKIDKLEKNSAKAIMSNAEEGSTEAIAKAEQSDETETKVEPSETVTKGNSMTKEVQVADEVKAEVVEKSQFEAIQKAFDEQKEQLQKALELVAKFEQEKKDAILKARFEQVKNAVKDDAKAEVLFKAVGLIENEKEFLDIVKALSDMRAVIDSSDLFVEKGVQVEADDTVKESAIARVIKARLSK
jgi:hypothetical protein